VRTRSNETDLEAYLTAATMTLQVGVVVVVETRFVIRFVKSVSSVLTITNTVCCAAGGLCVAAKRSLSDVELGCARRRCFAASFVSLSRRIY
jgi:hypothetical protein